MRVTIGQQEKWIWVLQIICVNRLCRCNANIRKVGVKEVNCSERDFFLPIWECFLSALFQWQDFFYHWIFFLQSFNLFFLSYKLVWFLLAMSMRIDVFYVIKYIVWHWQGMGTLLKQIVAQGGWRPERTKTSKALFNANIHRICLIVLIGNNDFKDSPF